MSALQVSSSPRSAASVLEDSLRGFRGDLTVADAAARAGLALAEAEQGLRRLAAGRGGHLAATERGELIYSFPRGLVEPVDERRRGARLWRATRRALSSAGRFVVRAWVSVVMIGYAALFVGVAIALAARDDDGDGMGSVLSWLGRAVIEALFWTFHPLSPFALSSQPAWLRSGSARRRGGRRLPFYDRVNRFVFGPPAAPPDPRARQRHILAEIRRLDGRVGPGDLMRVTGLDREGAERELLRLVVDHDGDIQVSDDGAVLYVFKALRSTAAAELDARAPGGGVAAPIWTERATVPPVTGNGAGTNVLLAALNGFNIAAGAAAVAAGLTVDRLAALVSSAHAHFTAVDAPVAALTAGGGGVPILLGWAPLLFSTALFALPAARALGHRRALARAAAENGRRALLRLVLDEQAGRVELRATEVEQAWTAAARAGGGGRAGGPRTGEIEAAVRALGGEVDVTDEGTIFYRFEPAGRERRALEAARAAAPALEARPARVVFSSAAAGTGEIDDA
jgi:hypothetical protein